MPLEFSDEAESGMANTANALKASLELHLEQLLPSPDKHPHALSLAMRQAVLSPGKRVRPMLCLMIQQASGGGDFEFALDCAAAIEFIHAASLVLDDLPCMDNANMRRGRPTSHIEFGESTAVLAAIGLINLAFSAVAGRGPQSNDARLTAASLLAETNGANGLAAGQVLDLETTDTPKTASEIETVNWLKTGVLFVTAAELGAIAGGLDQARIAYVKDFARHLGLAFQTHDDILDQTSSAEDIGKDVHQDTERQTITALSGVNAAADNCRKHMEQANAALEKSGLQPENINLLIQSVFRDLVRG
ncbi:MAG: polyprenyl synthetase family protein [Marinosulfonomonas sp.]